MKVLQTNRLFLAVMIVSAFLVIIGYGSNYADNFNKEDTKRWDESFMKTVKEGEQLFHSPLGSNTVSCDMCHPNAANTHPETYPKFQKQLGKVAPLREMINWCIKNPLEGQPIAHDDPRMFALEAYITYERRGIALDPGKH